MTEKVYLTCAETASLLRTALKKEFPGQKFSVKSSNYSGGASISVSWVDGPTVKKVEEITGSFEGAEFDGMIDLKSYVSHWLLPDGSVTTAKAPGTVGSRGIIPSRDNPAPCAGARLVSFGANYIFTNRRYTLATVQAVAAKVEKKIEQAPPKIISWGRTGEVQHYEFVNEFNGDRLVCVPAQTKPESIYG